MTLKKEKENVLDSDKGDELQFTRGLNKVQSEAVRYVDGPLLIVAGAGSGKTRVITNRIAYLVRVMGVRPWNIAAVTFTNKAAQEMRYRLSQMLDGQARDVLVRTFHSLGLYILSRNAHLIGLNSNFTVIDASAQKTIIKNIIKEEKMEANYLEPASVANLINQARDAFVSPLEYLESNANYAKEISHIYNLYIQKLRKANSLDFGDLLYESVRLLEKHSNLEDYYSNIWRYFMIDEYQDTNRVQYLLGLKIAKSHQNIMVVGDDDQSIYSWRGADIRNILSFEKDYPNVKILKLEQNYRSIPVILKAASSLIANNKTRRPKTLFSELPSLTESIHCEKYDDEMEEARSILRHILHYKNEGLSLDQIAIFYRTNAQSRSFERILRENNLPYIIVGDIQFYERKEIKDMISYLTVIVNPDDTLSLERILNVPARGVGESGLERLGGIASQKNMSLFEALQYAETLSGFRGAAKMTALYNSFLNWRKLYENKEKPSIIAERVLEESGYKDFLNNDSSPEAPGRLDNLYEFIASLREYEKECEEEQDPSVYDMEGWGDFSEISTSDFMNDPTLSNSDLQNKYFEELKSQVLKNKTPNLSEYLQKISLYTDKKTEDQLSSKCVVLMTLHNAKGLEFECVFLTGLEDGFLPHRMSIQEGNLEEERRLLYVGITRAKRYLHLTHVRSRWIFGSQQPCIPSRFINEIDSSVFSESSKEMRQNHKSTRTGSSSEDKFTGSHKIVEQNFSEGETVLHERYGEGRILKIEKMPIGHKLTIKFPSELRPKVFLSQYTPLKKLP